MSVETIGTVLSLALRRLATARTTAFQLVSCLTRCVRGCHRQLNRWSHTAVPLRLASQSVVALFAHVIVAHGDGVIPMLEAVVLPASAVSASASTSNLHPPPSTPSTCRRCSSAWLQPRAR